MNHQTVQVLLVDNDDDLEFAVRESLSNASTVTYSLTRARDLTEALDSPHSQTLDVLLIHVDSVSAEVLDIPTIVSRQLPTVSLILLAESLDDAIAGRLIAEGAQDCIATSSISRDLPRAIRHATGRKEAEEALTRERQLLRALIDHLPGLFSSKTRAAGTW